MKSFKSTKTGDTGYTKFGGDRINKTSPEIILVGALDEFQSELGELWTKLNNEYNSYNSYIWRSYYYFSQKSDNHKKINTVKSLIDYLIKEIYLISSFIHLGKPYKYDEELETVLLDSMKFEHYSNFVLPQFNDDISCLINKVRAKSRTLEITFLTHHISARNDADLKIFMNRMSTLLYAALCYFNNHVRLVTISL